MTHHQGYVYSLPKLVEGRLCIGDCYSQAWPVFIYLRKLQVECQGMPLLGEHLSYKPASRNARHL